MKKLTRIQFMLAVAFMTALTDEGKAPVIRQDEDALILGAEDAHGYDAVEFLKDGTTIVHRGWGEPSWDRWRVSQDGDLTYTGDWEDDRLPPRWLLEVL